MRMVPLASTLVGAGLLALACGMARAAAPASKPLRVSDAGSASGRGFFLDVGPGALVFDASATIRAGGAVLPGATVKIDPNGTLITEFGYRWNNASVSLTGGIPPVATVNGAGSIAGLGELGRIRYGPVVLAAQYHFTQLGRFQPYVGAGPCSCTSSGTRTGRFAIFTSRTAWASPSSSARNTSWTRTGRSTSTPRRQA
jgi:outer membrane protein